MTAQAPDILINDHPRIDFHDLRLYFVFDSIGELRRKLHLPAQSELPANRGYRTDLKRGYIATFRLDEDGALVLVQYEMPEAEPQKLTQKVGVPLHGDFWLCMRHFFTGPNTFVPFRNGRIVENEAEWQREDQTLHGIVKSYHRDFGLIISLYPWPAFIPESGIPCNLAIDCASLVGQETRCVIQRYDHEKRWFVVKPFEFLPAS